MEAGTAGRKLGIGLRLAAKAVRNYAEQAAATPISTPNQAQPATAAKSSAQLTDNVSAKAKGAVRGAKRFGEAIWGPMAHTGGVLWLEITGLFFALFALFFGQSAYKFRHNFPAGPERNHFLVYTAFTVIFCWFTISSFYKARRKEKKNRARQAALNPKP
jgi:hypothetical protein